MAFVFLRRIQAVNIEYRRAAKEGRQLTVAAGDK
jgi:hypothetical protein